MAQHQRTLNGKWIAIPFAFFALLTLPIGFWVRANFGPPAIERSEEAVELTTRVAALSPAVALLLDQVGAGHMVVARHGYDRWSDQSLPAAGDQAGIDYEALLAAEPTDVLLEWGSRELPDRLVELAEDGDWHIESYALSTLEDIAAAADALHARYVGSGTSPSNALEQSLQPVAGAEGVGRVLLLMSADPPQVLGPGSAHHQLLVRLGATPAITEGSMWIELDAEDVLRLAPDAIVLIAPGGIGGTEEALGRLATLPIPAIQSGRVGVIDRPTALLPTLALGEVADDLAELVREWSATD